MTPALLVIDMQKHFYHLNPVTFVNKLIPNIGNALSIARTNDILVIHLITLYKTDKSNWPKAFTHWEKMWCMEGSEGAKIIDGIEPFERERVIAKTRYSGFYDTELNDVLTSRGIDLLFLSGYSIDCCVRFTAIDAFYRNYILYILADCVHADFEDTDTSLSYLKRLTRANIISSPHIGDVIANKNQLSI